MYRIIGNTFFLGKFKITVLKLLTIVLIVSARGGERAGRDRCPRDQERRQGPQEAESGCFGTRSPCRQAGERAGCS